MFKIEPAKKQAGSSRIMGMPFLGFFGLSHFSKYTHFFKRPREANQHSGSYDAQSRAEVLVRVRASISVERDFGDLPSNII